MSGPTEAFVGKSKKYLTFKPGFIERKVVARKLSKVFDEEISEVEKLLPSGGFNLIESYGIDFKL